MYDRPDPSKQRVWSFYLPHQYVFIKLGLCQNILALYLPLNHIFFFLSIYKVTSVFNSPSFSFIIGIPLLKSSLYPFHFNRARLFYNPSKRLCQYQIHLVWLLTILARKMILLFLHHSSPFFCKWLDHIGFYVLQILLLCSLECILYRNPSLVLREDISIHRTNLKYCGKSPKIRFHSSFDIF